MAQDPISKLMAIAGKAPAAGSAQSANEFASSDDASGMTELPPPLIKKVGGSDLPSPSSLPSSLAANDQPARRVARRRPAGPVRGKIAANDDVPSIGGLIYALEQKPSGKIFRVAAAASLLWAVVGLAFGGLTLAPEWANGAAWSALLLNPVTFYTAAAVLVPIAIFWLLALLNWHISSLALKATTTVRTVTR